MAERLDPQVQAAKTVDKVSTPHADYRVIRSRHDDPAQPNIPEEVGDAEYLCIERGIDNHDLDYLNQRVLDSFFESVQDKEIINMRQLKEIYITDTISDEDFEKLTADERNVAAAYAAIGVTLLGSAGMAAGASALAKMRSTRRGLLIGAGSLGVAGAYATSPVSSLLVGQGFKSRILEVPYNHFYRYIGHFRNFVIAHKSEHIAKMIREQTGSRPKIAITVGANHGLVTNILEDTTEQQREEFIEAILKELETKLPMESVAKLRRYIYEIPVWDKTTFRFGVINMKTGVRTMAPPLRPRAPRR